MTSAPALPPPGRKRKHRSVSVDVAACFFLVVRGGHRLPIHGIQLAFLEGIKEVRSVLLGVLGVDPYQPWEMQHEPPLALRPWHEGTGDYDPPENDPRYMVPLQKEAHAKVTKEVDRPAIDKTRRSAKTQALHAARMNSLDDQLDETIMKVARKNAWWPKKGKRKIRGRGFAKAPAPDRRP